MSTQQKNTKNSTENDVLKTFFYKKKPGEKKEILKEQIQQTVMFNKNILQEIERGIFLLSIKKDPHKDILTLKKICDRSQYIMLPERYEQQPFAKISYTALKNLCHNQTSTQAADFAHYVQDCHLYIYYQIDTLERSFEEALAHHGLKVREKLTNRVMIVSNGTYNYPVPLAQLPAHAIFLHEDLALVMHHEISKLIDKFSLIHKTYEHLRTIFHDKNWMVRDGKIFLTHLGLTELFDYASLIDDIIHSGFKNRIKDYLLKSDFSEIHLKNYFPTVTVRSQVHLKARPQALAQIEQGYAVVAAIEQKGEQQPVLTPNKSHNFSLWLKRSERHLFRHSYKARVIFSHHNSCFALVGEHIATLALFPSLIKGVFESLNIKAPKNVRLIAHNQDVLTIAHDTASWVDINDVTQKATDLFRLVSFDGTDPLSLFMQVALPQLGVGNFELKVVPKKFFDLLDTASDEKISFPPGHRHYLLGLAYECLHEWGLAVSEFKKSLRLDAQDPEILHALGCALMEIGQVGEAMPFLKRAFDLAPDEPELANNLGQSRLECGHITEAITAFEQAVRLNPGRADYLKNLGNGYFLAHRHHEAFDVLNKALRCDPHSAEAHVSLAHLHLSSGDKDRAKKHALLAYKENPTDGAIADLLWYLTMGL